MMKKLQKVRRFHTFGGGGNFWDQKTRDFHWGKRQFSFFEFCVLGKSLKNIMIFFFF
jgi:hypothetical protein